MTMNYMNDMHNMTQMDSMTQMDNMTDMQTMDSMMSMEMTMMMPMKMLITWGTNATFLFKSWTPETDGQFAFALVMTFMFCFLYPLSLRIKDNFPRKTEFGEDIRRGMGDTPLNLSYKTRIILSILYMLQITWSMLIMLLFMTYNGWAILTVVGGLAIGYYLFRSGAEYDFFRDAKM